ncbi:MAG: Rieske 2Fe-2S domain-containing protein [Planctomycetaceae bacterium]
MAEWHRVATLAELPPGECREVVAAGRVIALFRVDDDVHAMDGVCPHAGGPLGQGTLEGCVVTCPWHGWQFDVTTGTHRLNDRITHPVFPVRIDGDDVFVELP